ncbi:23S rRNA (guanosine(2251)-2'-O)-methyltransferase RlmB [Mycoplasmopsis alligatoris]|uniref:RNA methyltransferase, TrmH family, group 3 n=1 Tax=Mycoplasmopsis alligatoris A21JP2 TaxID=747682 RepID=D4XVV4_9BACT|nr:23S rRNA (guanosine(2251)-2'-O)-methyltransferase RlmB [Mycoplasmopsis alligatoris]EFF41529.1 RNA methyltransferase, TrmH family, group 3 [Mycoplasmopsis alligatoris A21JP2]
MKKLIMCGKNSVVDAYNNNWPIEKVFLLHEQNKKFFKNAKFPVEVIRKEKMEEWTNENHQGFLATIKEINYSNLNSLIIDKPKLVLVLDHIQDPHNLGAIIRSANAAGVKHIILPRDRSAEINSTVIKVSSGGFIGIKFIRVNSVSATINFLKNNNFWVYASALDKKAQAYNQVSYSEQVALIVGNEGNGVSKSTLNMADQKIYIEQFGTVQSLNVSVATGILLFEIIKNQ